MNGKDTGGTAFPVDGSVNERLNPGMTLRDYFAAKIAQGYIASFAGIECSAPVPNGVANYAYAVADAMLKEREA